MPARSGRASRRAALACAWLAACNPPAAREAPATPAPPAADEDERCVQPPPGALAVLADETCPWALVLTDRSELALHELARAGPRAYAVAPPEGCADGCGWRGAMTGAGPVVVATRASRLREGAEEAWVGAALGGTTVRFVPLWYDRPAVGEGTPMGPSHALAPWVCGERLVLVIEPRLAAADVEEPSAGLRAAAGVYGLAGEELARSGPVPSAATGTDVGGCARVAVEPP